VVPVRLLGSRHNRRVLRRAVEGLVRGRRHEVVRLQECMRGLRTSEMPWLETHQHAAAAAAVAAAGVPAAGPTGAAAEVRAAQQQQQQRRRRRPVVPLSLHIAQQRWLSCWVWWLLVHFVLPLLRNNFYITESEPYRQSVFYYRCGPFTCPCTASPLPP
jgi:hypothetical protein